MSKVPTAIPTATVPTTNEKLLDDFTTVVAETEKLLKSVASLGDEKAAALRSNVDQALASAGDRLAEIRERSVASAGAAAKATDQYVQENPWRALEIVALASALAGLVAGVVIARR